MKKLSKRINKILYKENDKNLKLKNFKITVKRKSNYLKMIDFFNYNWLILDNNLNIVRLIKSV